MNEDVWVGLSEKLFKKPFDGMLHVLFFLDYL